MPTAPGSPDPVRPPKRGGRMADGAAVEEVAVWLEVNHRPVVTWMCTPEKLEELALGWLAGEGYITSVEDVHLRPCATDLGFWAEVDAARVTAVESAPRRQVLASGCGSVGTWLAEESLGASTLPRAAGAPHAPVPAVTRLRELFKEVFARGQRYQDTGGIHAAALTDGISLVAHAEDIGRHNAVDKVVGASLLARRPIRGMGLLVTGRISAELAAKAAQAGLAWVATPSVPSTLAVDIALRSGMTLIGRAVSGAPHIHCAE